MQLTKIESLSDLQNWLAVEPAPEYPLAFPLRHYHYNEVEPLTQEMVEERMTAMGAPMDIDHVLELANFEPDYFDEKTYLDVADFLNAH